MPHIIDETCCRKRHCNLCDKYRKELEQYQAIGTLAECKLAVERLKAKKVIIKDRTSIHCPSCDEKLSETIEFESFAIYNNPDYCPNCGQFLD